MPVPTLRDLSQAAQARVRKPRTRGRFAPIDAARRQLGLLETADPRGQAHISWLVDLPTGRIEDSRFLAFGTLASHAVADAFTETVRGRTVAEAALVTEEQIEALLRDDPVSPAFAGFGLEPLGFLRDLQERAVALAPALVLFPKPAEVQAYARKRKQDWDARDQAWLPLSLLAKIGRVDATAGLVLKDLAPGATLAIEGLHDDFRVVARFSGVAAETAPTLAQAIQDRLRATLHPAILVEVAHD